MSYKADSKKLCTHRILMLLLCCLFFNLLKSQTNAKDNGYTNCSWDLLVLDDSYTPAATDTCLVMVSTRRFVQEEKSFLTHEFDTTATLTYLNLYFNGNRWTAVRRTSLKEALLYATPISKDLIIYTEGLGRTFPSAVDRGTRMMRQYQVQVLLFDWPTEQPGMKPARNFKAAEKLVPLVAPAYALLLQHYQHFQQTSPQAFQHTTLFFHSMGNLILMQALQQHLLPMQAIADNAILNAACVPQKAHESWLRTLQVKGTIYITTNKKDRQLKGAKFVTGHKQLGSGASAPYVQQALYINFSNTLNKDHNYFLVSGLLLQKPLLKHFYTAVFHGQTPDLKNTELYQPVKGRPGYDAVKRYLPEKKDIGLSIGL